MDFLPGSISEYVEANTEKETPVLRELNRETNLKVPIPQMLSGHVQGTFLTMISKLVRPKCIVEIGTYTGYSAICLAQGLQKGGLLHTIDINEELGDMSMGYFRKAKLSKKIRLHIGNALDIIPRIKERIDLVYIDADKPNYSKYYDLLFPKVRKGGLIIADNALWGGRVIEKNKDKDTRGIASYNKKVFNDKRVDNILLPLRDGLMIARKH